MGWDEKTFVKEKQKPNPKIPSLKIRLKGKEKNCLFVVEWQTETRPITKFPSTTTTPTTMTVTLAALADGAL